MLFAAAMCEFSSLDRCAAYVAARMALAAVQRAAGAWPEGLAQRARRGAIEAMQLIAEAVSHDHASAGRRHCLREAITQALAVAATIDVVRAMGYPGDDLDELQRLAGRTVALLGMFLHANTAAIPEPDPPARALPRTVRAVPRPQRLPPAVPHAPQRPPPAVPHRLPLAVSQRPAPAHATEATEVTGPTSTRR